MPSSIVRGARLVICWLGVSLGVSQAAWAQGISNSSLQPFVIAVEPVIGRNGAVGGIAIDTRGVLNRVQVAKTGKLRGIRGQGVQRIPEEMARVANCRKVSLRGIAQALAECRAQEQPLPGEVLFLAGLQRIQYLLVYPEQHDVILAGPAEGWKVTAGGDVVGETTGQPVLRLDDLLVALRSARAAAQAPGITCSIDPTAEGLERLNRLLATQQLQMSRGAVSTMEKTLGASVITITGVAPDTHFAQVLVAADFLLKRLAMNFEPAPVADLPSYLQLLQQSDEPAPTAITFRLWLAPKYAAIARDPDGLAWELNGSSVQALTEDRVVLRDKQVRDAAQVNPLARRWADRFTEEFEPLAAALPVFAQLRNCIDLAVVGAILAQEKSLERTGREVAQLLDSRQVEPAHYAVPKTTPSRASFVQRGDAFIVSISGGVDLDAWGQLKRTLVRPTLASLRTKSTPREAARWWWD